MTKTPITREIVEKGRTIGEQPHRVKAHYLPSNLNPSIPVQVSSFNVAGKSFPSAMSPPTLSSSEVVMNSNVSILAEIPEDLHQSLKTYLDAHPTWDQDRVFAAALSSFLLQNNNENKPVKETQDYRTCARVYLETLFHS